MKVVLTADQVAAIHAHARETFPEECCGFLIGPEAEDKVVARVRRATNVVTENRERRYVIDPREILAVEKELRATGEAILGYYHSHPNHPAVPSEFDRGHAWPWYAYVILSIDDRVPKDLRAWSLEGSEGVFEPAVLETA